MSRPLHSLILCLVVPVFALLLSSCSLGYQSSYNKSTQAWKQKRHQMGGPWEGIWKSKTSGHTGKLWCIVTKPAAGSGNVWDFDYKAEWSAVSGRFHFRQAPINPANKRSLRFKGEKDLGPLGGKFQVNMLLQHDVLQASYTSKNDKGTFLLFRPESKQARKQKR